MFCCIAAARGFARPSRLSSKVTPRPPEAGADPVCGRRLAVDRRLANRNLRTALIAGTICLLVFALSFVVGLIY